MSLKLKREKNVLRQLTFDKLKKLKTSCMIKNLIVFFFSKRRMRKELTADVVQVL